MKRNFTELLLDSKKEDGNYSSKTIDLLFERLFQKYYSPSDLQSWGEWSTSFKGGHIAIKAKIKELLNSGYEVKTGYRASPMVRDAHDHIIFYKKI